MELLQYVLDHLGAVFDLLTVPYNGSIPHDFVTLGGRLLATIVGGVVGGLIAAPIRAWSSNRKRYGTTLRGENAIWIRIVPAGLTIPAVLASFVGLLAVRDVVVGLASIPVGGLVVVGLFRVALVRLPDWLTAGLLFVGTALFVCTFVGLGGLWVLVLVFHLFPTTTVLATDMTLYIYLLLILALAITLAVVVVWRDLHAAPSASSDDDTANAAESR